MSAGFVLVVALIGVASIVVLREVRHHIEDGDRVRRMQAAIDRANRAHDTWRRMENGSALAEAFDLTLRDIRRLPECKECER